MFLQIILILLIFVSFIIKLLKHTEVASKQSSNGDKPIPGPFCLPLLGYWPIFTSCQPPQVLYKNLAEKYGEIFQFKIGTRQIVVLNSVRLIREAFDKINLAGRPKQPTFELIKVSEKEQAFTFVGAESPLWKFHRKNAINALRLFAISKNSRLRDITERGFRQLTAKIDQNLNVPFNPKESISECVSGIIARINFGTDFDVENPAFKKSLELTEEASKTLKASAIIDCFPCAQFFFKAKLAKLVVWVKSVTEVVHQVLDRHKFDIEDSTSIRIKDVLDALYAKSLQFSPEELEMLGTDRTGVLKVTMDLFQAGYMTTMETFVWAVVLMAQHPEVQEKVHKELVANLHDSFPSLDDKQQTPYTEATLAEVFRFSSLVPLLLPHQAIQSETVLGYLVPKGALILANSWAVHFDEKVFPDPCRFRPERFLNASETELNTSLLQNLIPFSVGKRRCVGENLARQELYLLLSALLKKYTVSPAFPETIDYDVHVDEGLIKMLKPVELIFNQRPPIE